MMERAKEITDRHQNLLLAQEMPSDSLTNLGMFSGMLAVNIF